jgi:hypothetical protein
MDNYTEGPWRVLGNDLMQRIVSGKKIIAIPCMNDDVSAVQCGANARLIAASRDLYEQHKLNKKIRDTVDALLSEAGYEEDSSVRHNLAMMNFDAVNKLEK